MQSTINTKKVGLLHLVKWCEIKPQQKHTGIVWWKYHCSETAKTSSNLHIYKVLQGIWGKSLSPDDYECEYRAWYSVFIC